MKRFLLICLPVLLLLSCSGCGHNGSDEPPDYVGIFKSVRTSNDKIVFVKVTKDDGIKYEGFIDTLPVKGTWGQSESDALGLITNLLVKGHDKYFIDFELSISGSGVSGTAYRQ